jgi:CheY-like chemotaxis protein
MAIAKVMMIDDEPDIRQVGQMSLKAVGKWQVVLAKSGSEGVELAAKELPDVILLDVMMPGMDGPTTLAKLREAEASARIPVIFMTAKVQKHEVERYVALGAAGVISKPFDPMTLPREVRRIIEALPPAP